MNFPQERGSVSLLIIPLVIAILFLFGAIGFGYWAYTGRQDYKNNVDAKIQSAVTIAKQKEDSAKDAQYAQQAKIPYNTYVSPAAYSSVTIKYPKTWSAYVSDDTNSSPYIDGYFYPGVVPDTQSQNSAFALRVQLISESYSGVLNELQTFVQEGTTKIAPYQAPNVSGIIGARVDGQLTPVKSGSMVVFPVRDKTLKIWTEAPEFQDDFNNIILPNFTFSP